MSKLALIAATNDASHALLHGSASGVSSGTCNPRVLIIAALTLLASPLFALRSAALAESSLRLPLPLGNTGHVDHVPRARAERLFAAGQLAERDQLADACGADAETDGGSGGCDAFQRGLLDLARDKDVVGIVASNFYARRTPVAVSVNRTAAALHVIDWSVRHLNRVDGSNEVRDARFRKRLLPDFKVRNVADLPDSFHPNSPESVSETHTPLCSRIRKRGHDVAPANSLAGADNRPRLSSKPFRVFGEVFYGNRQRSSFQRHRSFPCVGGETHTPRRVFRRSLTGSSVGLGDCQLEQFTGDAAGNPRQNHLIEQANTFRMSSGVWVRQDGNRQLGPQDFDHASQHFAFSRHRSFPCVELLAMQNEYCVRCRRPLPASTIGVAGGLILAATDRQLAADACFDFGLMLPNEVAALGSVEWHPAEQVRWAVLLLHGEVVGNRFDGHFDFIHVCLLNALRWLCLSDSLSISTTSPSARGYLEISPNNPEIVKIPQESAYCQAENSLPAGGILDGSLVERLVKRAETRMEGMEGSIREHTRVIDRIGNLLRGVYWLAIVAMVSAAVYFSAGALTQLAKVIGAIGEVVKAWRGKE